MTSIQPIESSTSLVEERNITKTVIIGILTGGVLGSHYQDIFAFIVLILVLTLRPQGLLGERVADRA